MNKKQTEEKESEKCPIETLVSLPDIGINISWFDLLGKNKNDMPDNIRRERWDIWKEKVLMNGDFDILEYWTNNEPCGHCRHLSGDWCTLMEIPVTVNPILTMREGIIGMACMGTYKEEPGQRELEFENNELPF